MQDFPLNAWQFAKLRKEIREHTLLILLQNGYFSTNGTDEDFKAFCKQVEVNAQSLERDKIERHRNWVETHPDKYREQQERYNNRGRGRGRYNNNGRGRGFQHHPNPYYNNFNTLPYNNNANLQPRDPSQGILPGRGDARARVNPNGPTTVIPSIKEVSPTVTAE
jgi:hypothetical protein